jgi:adenylate kinase family enzyme
MKILITGNMGAGKSYLIQEIKKKRPALTCYSVDTFRKQLGDGSVEKDIIARNHFLRAIQQPGTMLMECMGLGDLGLEVRDVLRRERETLQVLLLKVPLEQCLSRLANRNWDVPYPGTPESGVELCKRSHSLFEAGEIEKRFNCLTQEGVHTFSHCTPGENDLIQHFIFKSLDKK